MRVKDFAGFMKSRSNKVNESDMSGHEGEMGYTPEEDMNSFGANPEEDTDLPDEIEGEELEGDEEEKEVTLEDLKAMVEDLTERVEKLEGGGEDEEGEEGAEGEEGEEGAEGEEDIEGDPDK